MDKNSTIEPLVSVVMCTYNARAYIESAVECILKQTYSNWELIISDDCSTDGTREWLQTLKNDRVRLFLQEKNLGYVANKNFGHIQAKGDYITQLDNDDLTSLDRIEKQIDVVVKQPEILMVSCGYNRIDNKSEVYETNYEERDRLITTPERRYPFWFPSLLVHKSLFQKFGYFDEYFSGVYGDDIYWTTKANLKFPIYHIGEVLYSYRNNPNSITNVLTNDRKLIFTDVLDLLLEQVKKGNDWLSKGEFKLLKDYEFSLAQNKKFMGEQCRLWAAKATDKGDFNQAKVLLSRAFKLYPLNNKLYSTLFYYTRRRL